MKIEWVKRMLVKWGEAMFNAARGSSGLGTSYPAYQMVHIRGTGCGEPPVDAEVMRLEAVMAHVKSARPELYQVAYEIYVQCLSTQTTAGRLRCHRDTVYSRLDSLHLMVANRLSEKPKQIASANR